MWNNSNNKIEFNLQKSLIDVLPKVNRSNKFYPEWFKKLKRTIPNTTMVNAGTVKTCIPVLDAMSLGYIIPLWADLLITVEENYELLDLAENVLGDFNRTKDTDLDAFIGQEIQGHTVASVRYNTKRIKLEFPQSLDLRQGENLGRHSWEQVGDYCSLKNFRFGQELLKLTNPWSIKTPKGWSCYFKNVPNNWENNIEIIEGSVDTDSYVNCVNFPFVWTGEEVGETLIPKGTPLVHVIPYKRQDTEFSIGTWDEKEITKINLKLGTLVKDKYKSLFWHKRKN